MLCIGNCPVEILEAVTALLPLYDAFNMARTCRSAYSLWGKRLRTIPDNAQLSRILEQSDVTMMRQLFEAGRVDVDTRVEIDGDKVPLLFCAWDNGHTDMVDLLLDYGASTSQFVICDQRAFNVWAMRTPMARHMTTCVRRLKSCGVVEVRSSAKLEWFERQFGRSKKFSEDRATGYELSWFGREVPRDIDARLKSVGQIPDSVVRSCRGTTYT
jgi:hypothetical protein